MLPGWSSGSSIGVNSGIEFKETTLMRVMMAIKGCGLAVSWGVNEAAVGTNLWISEIVAVWPPPYILEAERRAYHHATR